jgi:hypothetical protein
MIIIAGQIEGLSTRKDKTIRLTIGTQELSPAKAAEILSLNQTFAYMAIKPEPFMKEETDLLASIKTDMDNLKTPAQRMRGVLYRIYEVNQDGYNSFAEYYNFRMEQIIERLKKELSDQVG